MAPNMETMAGSYTRNNSFYKPSTIQRAVSNLSSELSKEQIYGKIPTISDLEEPKCECCGMSEECTPEYVRRVREKFHGKWICGLCSEAVKEEMEKKGVEKEEALNAHVSLCVGFNRVGRTQPLIGQAKAMREILRKVSNGGERAKSASPRNKGNFRSGGITRSSSCIPAITREIDGYGI